MKPEEMNEFIQTIDEASLLMEQQNRKFQLAASLVDTYNDFLEEKGLLKEFNLYAAKKMGVEIVNGRR